VIDSRLMIRRAKPYAVFEFRNRLFVEWHETTPFGVPKTEIATCQLSEQHLWSKLEFWKGHKVLLHMNGNDIVNVELDMHWIPLGTFFGLETKDGKLVLGEESGAVLQLVTDYNEEYCAA
jgi:hypothetical protein